jgi:hypothetical protein
MKVEYLIVGFAGALGGALMIWIGWNFRIGSWWIAAPEAYLPAAICGAAFAVAINYFYRRSQRD